MSFIKIDEHSKTPKYKQIVNSIISAIESGVLTENDKLPSVNKLLTEYDISRDTVVKAFQHLKKLELIDSVPGKGFYIKKTSFKQKAKVFLLFNKLSQHKKMIYDSFSTTLGDDASIDFYIYNNDYQLFKNLITSHSEINYTHYVIIPHFVDGGLHAADFINEHLDTKRLIILDKKIDGLYGEYAAIFQDFKNDIYGALVEALPMLEKYSKLKIIFPSYSYHPREILSGFGLFCDEYAFEYSIVPDINEEPIKPDEVYINLMEDDLVTLIKRIKELNLKVGNDVGIISYNETPLKEVLLDGITIVSTDFEQLGIKAAELVLSGAKMHVENPFRLIVRNSL